MTVRVDLQNALESWVSDGREAFEISDELFADVIAPIRNRFIGTTLAEAELMLADVRRATEESLHILLRDTVSIDAVIDIVASRFFGED
jgi:hypothetical protein